MTFKILCFDGGGIRGLITALLVQDLDRDFHIIDRADGFSGTSTGGLIALGLANGNDIGQIIEIYESQGNKIFVPNHDWLEVDENQPKSPNTLEALFSGPGLIACQYQNDGLKTIAAKLFGDQLISSSHKFLAIASVRLCDRQGMWQPIVFSNENEYQNTKMADAALATSAAPTYFPPYKIGTDGFFADGGLYANNPSLVAISRALNNCKANFDDLRLLSLGTGASNNGIPESSIPKPLKWGVNYWMWPFESHKVPAMSMLNIALDCTTKAPTLQAQEILSHRFQRGGEFELGQYIPLDDYQKVAVLKEKTAEYIKSPEWKNVREWIAKHWS